jgi:hypothetical protein
VSRSTEFRATSPHTVDEVYAAMTDKGFLEDRLREMGGPGAAVLDYSADADGAAFRVRHGIDEKHLPGVVRSFVGGGGITIERTETWKRAGDHYDGTVGVDLPGMPAGATGTMVIGPAAAGTEFVVKVDVTVRVPIFGGKIEETVAEQIVRLLSMETTYTLGRLQDR